MQQCRPRPGGYPLRALQPNAASLNMEYRLIRRVLCVVCGCLVALGGSEALAQFQSSPLSSQGRTSTGTFGNRTVGAAGGLSARSGSMFGGGGAGGSVAGATQQNQQVGMVEGSERFLRSNRQGQFVGADTADTPQIGSFGQALNNFIAGPNGRNARDANQSLNTQTQNRRPYRTTIRVGFDYPAPAPGTLAAQLTTQLQRARLAPSQNSVVVEVQGHTAILRGQVATAHARALAEQLVLLEPGIEQVDNQLEVAEPASR